MVKLPQPHVLFRLGRQPFAIPLAAVKDVAKSPTLMPVPHAQPMVRGLAVLREQLATALDLRARFGLPPSVAGTFTALAIDHEGERVALLVDRVEDVVALAAPEPVAASRDPIWQGVVAGIVSRGNEQIVVLDVAGVIDGS